MADDYAHGGRDGLRLALVLLATEQAKWAALVSERPSWRTNAVREVRRKTLAVAGKRVGTVPGRMTPKDGVPGDELAAAIV